MPVVRVFQQDESGPAEPLCFHWVYVQQGARVIVTRSDAQGRLLQLRPGAPREETRDYTTRLDLPTGTTLGLLTHDGPVPLSEQALQTLGPLFLRRVLGSPDGAGVPTPAPVTGARSVSAGAAREAPKTNTVVVTDAPPLLVPATITVTSPQALALWPLVLEPPEAAYYTDGIGQGMQAMGPDLRPILGENLTRSGNSAPRPAAALDRKPLALQLRGTAPARARNLRLQILDAQGRAVAVAASAEQAATQELTLSFDAPAGAFETTLFFENSGQLLGQLLTILVRADATPELGPALVASVLLVGVALGLKDDAVENTNGQQAGPIPTVRDERVVIDFADQSVQRTFTALRAAARARRMVVYLLKTRARPLNAADPTPVLHTEMPLWAAEVAFVGLTRQSFGRWLQLRQERLPETPAECLVQADFSLQLSWPGSDNNYPDRGPARGRTEGELTGGLSVTFRPGPNGATGEFSRRAERLLFPVDRRRLPEALLEAERDWLGQRAPAICLEWQPALVDAQGRERFLGGDGELRATVTVSNGPRTNSIVPGDLRLTSPTFRVVGDPSAPRIEDNELNALVTACVREYLADSRHHTRATAVLSEAEWISTVQVICEQESQGMQFNLLGTHLSKYTEIRFARESGTPLYGPPQGYGIAQLDPPPHANATWSLHDCVREQVIVVLRHKANAAYAKLADHLTGDRRSKAIFRREVVKRYNGGSEFEIIGGELKVCPSNGALKRKGQLVLDAQGRPQVTAFATYPNHVLERLNRNGSSDAYASVDYANGTVPLFTPASASAAAESRVRFSAEHYGTDLE